MISRFFIDRPIFAAVLSIVITLAGGMAVFTLPIAQYPPIVPPTIQVMCNYPGASAQVVAESVAAPIEQYVNGVEDMLYMSSNCTNDGTYSLSVTFKPGVKLNFAQVLVQNRVNLALPSLPDVVKQTGVTTRKRSPDILQIVSLNSPNDRYDQLYVSNYAAIHVQPELARVDGVGDAILFGAQNYSMRVWVDPDKLAGMNLNASDVVTAIRNENAQVACGRIGQEPAPSGQQLQITLTTLGRLIEPEQFDNIVVKRTASGRIVRIKDVGHVELGAQNRDVITAMDGKPCGNIGIFQLSDANALDTADRIKSKMAELSKLFPDGLGYSIYFDTTPFIRESVDEVVRTLLMAVVLVAIVVLVFLQSWRSAIIPLVAVPVGIVGTFAVMAAIGFNINNLTLFGLVLAIGIVVDDAIVVVEAVEHHIEMGMRPREATIQAMHEVSGPVVAVALVLTAVFMPCTFITGITGSFFKQFAVTISVSTVISAFNSLTLSPALAAILLKPTNAKKDPVARLLDFFLGWFFRLFNSVFRRATNGYTRVVELMLRGSAIVLVLYGCLLLLTQWGLGRLPVGYIPAQDKGYLLISVALPDASAVEQTAKVVREMDEIVQHTKGVAHRLTLAGQSFTLGVIAPNAGQFFVILDGFDKRRDPSLYYLAIKSRLEKEFTEKIPNATVYIFGPPPVQGLGNAGGWKVMIEDRSDAGLVPLQQQTQGLVNTITAAAAPAATVKPTAIAGAPGGKPAEPAPEKQPARAAENSTVTPVDEHIVAEARKNLTKVLTLFTVKYPQLFVDVNRDQCHTMGLNLSDVYSTLQTYLGSLYVNDFNLFGRTWQVVVQAEPQFRNKVKDVGRMKVRNAAGQMAPLASVATIHEINGPLVVTRYNLYPAATIQGDTPVGISSGQAIIAFEKLAHAELPKKMAFEWTEITYLQILAANTGMILFGLAVLLVFLVLAAQYESWSLPLAVILVVPMCLLSAIAGVAITHSDINVFTQIGFVVLVGLASKNAVLIVEFAKHKYESGMSRHEATLEAVRLRLRPILMTSFAFILGVAPLLVSTGAGFEMRRTLGTAVFSGMLGVTFFGIFLTPVFFNVIELLGHSRAFASKGMQQLGRISLGIFALGYPRAWLRRILSRPAASPSQPAQNKELIAVDQSLHQIMTLDNGHPQNGHPETGHAENGHAQNGHPQNGHPTNGSGFDPDQQITSGNNPH